ncbi:MAG TPA: LuxR C-terminal-related transcriptional regulator, partial [Vineibacter sp.]|nr:LuxR C-terminal-related transcriptional regulator [Vineibacter sp.]
MSPPPQNIDLRIIETIQDAALQPGLWRQVLELTARRVGGVAGNMSIEDPVRQTGLSLARFGYDPSFTDRYVRYYGRLNPMIRRKAALPVGATVSTSMLMPSDEFARTEYYNDWVRPQGFHGAVGTVLGRHGAKVTWLATVWPQGAGEPARDNLDALARLVPYMVRSLQVMQRLDLAVHREDALHAALARVAHAVMLVDHRGRLMHANAAAEALLQAREPLALSHGRLIGRDAGVDAVLQAALARAVAGGADPAGIEEFIVPRGGRRPLLLTVVPVSPAGREHVPDLHATAIVFAVDPEARLPLRVDAVVRACGLTPAESRVLAAIVAGQRLEAVAQRLGVARGTVKTHLERIFLKT